MPHEVHTVSGHVQNAGGIEKSQGTIDDTAAEIAAVYDAAESRGGEIVGSHVVPGEVSAKGGGELGRISGFVLYLVEKLPEEVEIDSAE